MINIKSNQDFTSPWIIGHRGDRANYPENTLAAFQGAIEAGAVMIELDVMLSRDRKVVVIHDANLERTTDGYGNVADFSLAELKLLDAGSWYDTQFADERLPELNEVLDLVADRVYLNIEIKSNAYESPHPPDAIEKQVVTMVKKKNMQGVVLISSFNMDFLVQIAAMEDPPAIALISDTVVSERVVDTCTRLKMFSWHPDQRIVTPKQVKMMHTAGLRVFPYNVDTFDDYLKVVDMKIDGVITDDPELAGDWSKLEKTEANP